MKIFLDTNVIVSALATRGLCADLFHAILAEHELVLGETVLGEVHRVLHRKLRVPTAAVEEIEGHLRGQAKVVRAPEGRRIKGLDKADSAVVAEAARQRPGHPALLFQGRAVSYGELERQSTACATSSS